MTAPLKVLAYHFPHWHEDPRDAGWIHPGFTEWELARSARPRFPGHVQPRVPAWGELDESQPEAMAREIELARDHGISGFLFDTYWYEDGPYLQGALNNGFLASGSDFGFAVMWANHDLVDLYPMECPEGVRPPRLLKPGRVSPAAFERFCDVLVADYFTHPSYVTIEGRPFFSIYQLSTFVDGVGGIESARDLLEGLDARCREAGLPGVHIDVVVYGMEVLPGQHVQGSWNDLLAVLPVRSASSYTWMHHVDLEVAPFPLGDWDDVRRDVMARFHDYADDLVVPFLPNVSVGWDDSPRTNQDYPWERNAGYGWSSVYVSSAETVTQAVSDCRRIIQAQLDCPPIITVNAWNEWTEGAYLLPDTWRGLTLLKALERGIAEANADEGDDR